MVMKPYNLQLASSFAPLMFAMLHHHSPLTTLLCKMPLFTQVNSNTVSQNARNLPLS